MPWEETGVVPDHRISSLREIIGWLDHASYPEDIGEGAS
jgi:putative hydrolase of the HAD superfamily